MALYKQKKKQTLGVASLDPRGLIGTIYVGDY